MITALKAMTIWPAYQHFEEGAKGSLEVGKLADFVILSKDPTAVPPTTIADIRVTETVKEGRTIFRLAPGARAEAPAADITPLLAAMSGHRQQRANPFAAMANQDPPPVDGCIHNTLFALAAAMASGPTTR